jgi:coenzyme PQQ synthesis protein D (PqqD)
MTRAARLPLSRTDNLVIRELDDETLVYDMERDEAHCLNHTAALVWQQCDGKTTAAQAARLLQSKLDVKVDTDLVWLAVKQLKRFHLVEATTKTPSVSRRDLVLKYAPAALVLLPVIISIASPPPAQAASCSGACSTFVSCPAGCRCSFSTLTCVPSGGA